MRIENSPGHRRLRQFVEDEADRLLDTIRMYVIQTGLATGATATIVASELLNEVVVEALKGADRFDPTRQPMAWLLGIALNLIKRRKVSQARRNHREPLLRDLTAGFESGFSDDELFEPFLNIGLASEPGAGDILDELLSSVSDSDQHILRLAVQYDFSGEKIATALKITPGAARVRLHRAIQRLRVAQESRTVENHD
ncbi:MAG: sigma-70 family RNA polymerase sigma factor [Chloroflexi bacterium]|nr:sigma-70 family RNA polymerase sigma factor [Chloroflexota bacterium]